jgi:hypothetical protein
MWNARVIAYSDKCAPDLFQKATEPLFNSSPVDSDFRMDVVFPECLNAASFMNALLYSVVLMENKGRSTLESLRLHGMALQHLHHTMSSSKPNLTHSDVGAIMILQGVAVSVH